MTTATLHKIEQKSFRAARTICALGDWSISNLRLQKVLYIAQMLYLGQHKEPLFADDFEAWDYGPVEPHLYYHVRGFGNRPIVDGIFLDGDYAVYPKNSDFFRHMERVHNLVKDKTTSQLVAITHREGGAWARNYQSGVEGVKIPKKDMLDEYQKTYEAG